VAGGFKTACHSTFEELPVTNVVMGFGIEGWLSPPLLTSLSLPIQLNRSKK